MTELVFDSAVNLLRRLRAKEVSCTEVMAAHLEQIARHNPQLNAIVSLDEALAYERAQANDDAFDTLSQEPLYGLPIAHKDLVQTRGMRTTFGSPLFADNVPDTDDVIVERIRGAGAINIGKTNVPEFGAGSQTFNAVFGATGNPFDPTKTCGGSSGGAAAALAAGMLPIADGSDFGGSLRNPAAFCNVLGLRPTAGRVPDYPSRDPFGTLAVLGPMARNVDDLALLFSVMAGPDPRVPIALTDPGESFREVIPLTLRGLRVGVTLDFGNLSVDQQIRERVSALASTLEGLGATVDDACPDLRGASEAFYVLRAHNFHGGFGALPPAQRPQLKDSIIWNLEAGEALSADDLVRANQQRAVVFESVAEFFTSYDFLIGPTTQVLPFDLNLPWVTEIDGVPQADYLAWMQSCCVITTTGCPALSLPAGFSTDGLPIGAQLVAPIREEARLLSFAKSLEEATSYATQTPF
jgi:amidase